MGKVLIFLYNDMNPGGIQTYMYNMIKNMLTNQIKVIWVCTNRKVFIHDGYSDFINEEQIEIVNLSTLFESKNKFFNVNDDIRIICFSPLNYLYLDKIKQKFSEYRINTYYIMPHFENKDYFPDRFFKFKPIKLLIKSKLKELFLVLDKNNQILFFNNVHCEKLEQYYGFNIIDIDKKLARSVFLPPNIEYEYLAKKAERKEFRIITVSRFEFPHKGYVIGLINIFSKLKEKYSNLYLDIVGDGDGAKLIKDSIAKFPSSIQTSITLHGYKAYDELEIIFRKANLNIGVGGALIDGARYAVPSLPARHYSYSCEVYGFLPNSFKKILSEETGDDLETYIKEIIDMADDDYIKLCMKTTETDRLRGKSFEPLWIFESKENYNSWLSKEYKLLLLLIKYRAKVCTLFQRLLLLVKDPNVFFSKLRRRIINMNLNVIEGDNNGFRLK